MEHVTQQILDIRSVAVVAMGIYVNNHSPFPCEIFHYFEIKCKKGVPVILVATARLARHYKDIKIGTIISMGWG